MTALAVKCVFILISKKIKTINIILFHLTAKAVITGVEVAEFRV